MRIQYVIIITLLLVASAACAEPVVIVNQNNSNPNLSKKEVIGLFMGRYSVFPNGSSAVPYNQKFDNKISQDFYKGLTRKSIAQINAYWARLLFAGRLVPPPKLSDYEKILEKVRSDPGAIAYIDNQYVDDTVKVVYYIN